MARHIRTAGCWLALLLTVFALPIPAQAQERIALVIGNGRYQHATPLPNPTNDARDVAAALREIGFEVMAGADLDRAKMQELLRDFLRKARTAKVALLFYAGHGLQVDGRNYLLPIDANLESRIDLDLGAAVELDRVLANLDDPARANIIILDACRDNPLARRLAATTRSGAVGTGLAPYTTLGTGTLIAFSTAPGRVAEDGAGSNSPFTLGLVKHLRTPGLEVRQMLTRVRHDVATVTRGQQVPWDNSSLFGDVYLAGLPKSAAPAPAAPAAKPAQPDPCSAAPSHWKSAEAIGTIDAFEDHVLRYPNCAYAGLARAHIAAIKAAAKPAVVASAPPAQTTPPPMQPFRGAPVSWRMQTGFPSKMPTGADHMARRLADLSGGSFKVDVLPAGSVVPAFQIADAVDKGVLDAGLASGAFFLGKDRAFALMPNVPFGFDSTGHAAWRIRADVKAAFDELIGRVVRLNVVAMPCGALGRGSDLWTKKPLRSVADLRGLKIASLGLPVDVYQQLGAAVIALPQAEIIPAADRGIIDGFHIGSPTAAALMGAPDVSKVTHHPSLIAPTTILDLFINKARWDALPPDHKSAIEHACAATVSAMIAEYDAADRQALDNFTRRDRVNVSTYPAAIQGELYRTSRKVMAGHAAQSPMFKRLMDIVESMRSSTLAANLR